MRNVIPFRVCKRHLIIIFLGIIALTQVLSGSIAGATKFEYISDVDCYPGMTINNAINIEAIVSLESLPVAPELFADSPLYPEASFSMNVSSGNAPLTVLFTDTSKNANKWSWIFGDGGTSTEQNPVHTYSIAKSYNVTLTASNTTVINGNGSSTATKTIVVNLLPEASFRTNISTGNAPLTVQFNDTSKYATILSWVFGDGGTSKEQNPVHTYSKADNYTVTFIASNGNGSSTATTSILAKQIPEASFRTNISTGNAPLTVQFNDTSKYATGWSWTFGDGGTSTELNPVHTYLNAGNFTATLKASNENGSIEATTSILAKLLPEASFRTNISSGNAPLTVLFNDTSKNVIGWNWIFGDGGNSTEQNPVHTYEQSGNYTTILTASNENGSSTFNTTILAKLIPIANFSTNTTSGNPPLTVQFNDTSNYTTGWSWTFGDSSTATEQNPVHTYLKSGNYTVTLKASNENGSSPFNATILVNLLPTADFKTSSSNGNTPLTVQFNDTSQNAESRSWDFTSDGTTDSSDLNPVYVYSSPGTYNATLTVSNANGTASKNTTITVSKATSTTSSTGSTGGGGISGTTKSSKTTSSSSKSKSSSTSTKSENLSQNSTNISANLTNGTTATNATNSSQNTTDTKKSPGFETFFSIVSLLAIFIYRRRTKSK